MKTKFLFLSAVISSCLLTINCSADTGTSSMPATKRPCYPASMYTSGPNSSSGYNGNYSFSGNASNSMNTMGAESSSSPQNTQPSSTQQFVGTVKTVNRVELPNQTQVQLLLSTGQGDLLVILGPASFVDQAKVRFLAGDKVTVTGYPVSANGQQVILAAQIQKNGFTLQLLNENRQPMWANSSYAGMQQNQGQGNYTNNPSQSPMQNSRY
jgi:hypothetical protein